MIQHSGGQNTEVVWPLSGLGVVRALTVFAGNLSFVLKCRRSSVLAITTIWLILCVAPLTINTAIAQLPRQSGLSDPDTTDDPLIRRSRNVTSPKTDR